mmetsp:Transcript_11276/g.48095  ORF Transcript_11276/g.48095 Transcript_11276/m.48095 type:complete len:223 (+) Transcript_11276:586-1254(+)
MEMRPFHAVGSMRTKRASTGVSNLASSTCSVRSYLTPANSSAPSTYVHGPSIAGPTATLYLVTRSCDPRRACIMTPTIVRLDPASTTYHCLSSFAHAVQPWSEYSMPRSWPVPGELLLSTHDLERAESGGLSKISRSGGRHHFSDMSAVRFCLAASHSVTTDASTTVVTPPCTKVTVGDEPSMAGGGGGAAAPSILSVGRSIASHSARSSAISWSSSSTLSA